MKLAHRIDSLDFGLSVYMQANQIAAQKAAPNDATPIKAKGLACLGHILKAARATK